VPIPLPRPFDHDKGNTQQVFGEKTVKLRACKAMTNQQLACTDHLIRLRSSQEFEFPGIIFVFIIEILQHVMQRNYFFQRLAQSREGFRRGPIILSMIQCRLCRDRTVHLLLKLLCGPLLIVSKKHYIAAEAVQRWSRGGAMILRTLVSRFSIGDTIFQACQRRQRRCWHTARPVERLTFIRYSTTCCRAHLWCLTQ